MPLRLARGYKRSIEGGLVRQSTTLIGTLILPLRLRAIQTCCPLQHGWTGLHALTGQAFSLLRHGLG